MSKKLTLSESLAQFLSENVATEVVRAEAEKVILEAIPKILQHLKKYKDCKIGKSGSIERRFNTSYESEGYVELIPVAKCKYKEAMDYVETYLIKYFRPNLSNKTDLEVGNRTYSGDYWIYVVHKGEIIQGTEQAST